MLHMQAQIQYDLCPMPQCITSSKFNLFWFTACFHDTSWRHLTYSDFVIPLITQERYTITANFPMRWYMEHAWLAFSRNTLNHKTNTNMQDLRLWQFPYSVIHHRDYNACYKNFMVTVNNFLLKTLEIWSLQIVLCNSSA